MDPIQQPNSYSKLKTILKNYVECRQICNPKHTSHKTSDEDMYLNMDYEMHVGTKLDNNKNPDSFPYYAPRTDFFVDNTISPGYFKDRFMDTFGPVAYVLEHCGIYFSVFLLFKLIIDVVVMVIIK